MAIEGSFGVSRAMRTDDAANFSQAGCNMGQSQGLSGRGTAERSAGLEGPAAKKGAAYGPSSQRGSGGAGAEGAPSSLSAGGPRAGGPKGKGHGEAKASGAKGSGASGPKGGEGAAPAEGGGGQSQNMIAQLLQLIVQMMKSGQLKPEEAIKLLEGLAQMAQGGGGGAGEGVSQLPSEAAA